MRVRRRVTEPVGEVGNVFEGLELRLGVGVVIRGPGSRVRAADPEVDQHLGHRFRRHRAAPVGVDRVRDDQVTGHCISEESFATTASSA